MAEYASGSDTAIDENMAITKETSATKLVIHGSGAGPIPMLPGRTRHMTSHVMVSNGAAYVVDCGLGVTNQFARSRVSFTAIRSIFITHHHPDHNIEYGPLLLLGWTQGMPNPVRAVGPPPLKQMTNDFLHAYKTTIDFWAQDFNAKALMPPDVIVGARSRCGGRKCESYCGSRSSPTSKASTGVSVRLPRPRNRILG
jgi:ribonuclease BN (tRNA processing enzyme)